MAEAENAETTENQEKNADQQPQQPAPAGVQAAQASVLNLQYDESAHATYSNLCRITGTPEEVVMDFALHPNVFGQVLDETVKVDHRIVMGYQAAKRTALLLLDTIRRHEEHFGEIELDPRRRLRIYKTS